MGKRGRPVVFNACKTCKIRRVKCDGARPACARCRDTGRKCDGYIVSTFITPSQQTDSQELRSFKYFCEKTSFEICGHYDEEFWRSQAVQLASSQPQLWHMLVAIGALHENVKQTTWKRNAPAMSSISPVFALRQCNKAIALLTGEASGTITPGVMLTSCVFFMAFEMLQSNLESSLNHLRNAWSILDAWTQGAKDSTTKSERELIEEYLSPIIHRFSESCDIVWPGTTSSDSIPMAKQNIVIHTDVAWPQTFFSLNHASSCLHNLLDRLFVDLPTPEEYNEDEKSSLYKESQSNLQLWWEKYQQFLDAVDGKMLCPANQRRLALLEIHYYSATIMYAARLFDDEMIYDIHSIAFANIVKQCRQVLDLEKEQMNFAGPRLTMSFDLGIIMPLYLTASRCRDPLIRREALGLLTSSPRREGIWLSWVTGMVAEQIISIEEQGLDKPQSSSDVPLQNRIELVEMHYNPRQIKLINQQKCFEPILQLSWISAVERDDPFLPPYRIKTKSINLPITRDDHPGPRPYWVLMPRGTGFSQWKLLLGKKVFTPPSRPFLKTTPEMVDISEQYESLILGSEISTTVTEG